MVGQKYLEYLQSEYAPSKIPYIKCVSELTEEIPVRRHLSGTEDIDVNAYWNTYVGMSGPEII